MKRLSDFFAFRYLLSKKSHTLINVISIISSLSIAIPVAALIILLSVFGGLIELMQNLNSAFDADLKISSATSANFNPEEPLSKIANTKNIISFTSYLEEQALAEYNNSQYLVKVRGVDSLYSSTVTIEDMVSIGEYRLKKGDIEYGVVGMGVAYNMGIAIARKKPIKLYAPSAKKRSFLPSSQFNSTSVFPSSIFSIDAQTDGEYILTSIESARKLFAKNDVVSAIALKVNKKSNIESTKKELSSALGENFIVEDRYEQKKSLYQLMEGEKKMVFIIAMLIVAIASFTLIASIVMLMTDKKEQCQTLRVLGAKESFIDAIFIKQGLLITSISLAVGVVIGVGFVALQKWGEVIKIDSQTLIIDSYPVALSALDVINVVWSVGLINTIIIFVTVKSRKQTN